MGKERTKKENKTGGSEAGRITHRIYHHQLHHELQTRTEGLHRFLLWELSLQSQGWAWTTWARTWKPLGYFGTWSPWAPSTRAPQGRQSARAWQCLWKLPLQYSCWKASRRYQPSIKQQQVQAQLVRIKTYTGGNRGTGLGFQLRHQIGLQEITPQGLG